MEGKTSSITTGLRILGALAGIVVLTVPAWTAARLLLMTAIMLFVLGVVGVVRAFTFGKARLAGH